jgi:hypothetical protein
MIKKKLFGQKKNNFKYNKKMIKRYNNWLIYKKLNFIFEKYFIRKYLKITDF